MVQKVQIELFINSNTIRSQIQNNKLMPELPDISGICYMIQTLNSYNLLTEESGGKSLLNNYRPDEKI